MSEQDHQRDRETILSAMRRPAPRTIRFEYYDLKGNYSNREIEPYRLTATDIYGWCLGRNAWRQFSLERLGNVTLGEPFNPRDNLKIENEQPANVESQ